MTRGEPFCVVIPPPNATGSLHISHAFENTLIDYHLTALEMELPENVDEARA